ncbi:CocE/NonD family hydrolase [Actinoplanes sp. NPDC049265]|uniref:CocE/NonD family hydrolase n=1 Tax=Actinoplanes sp. NPDC049265 TaxID=3363902 RepID=UPI00371AC463
MPKLLENEVRDGSVVIERDVRIPTRDGGFVAADVYRPAGPGPFPALYAVSPYGKDFVDLPAIPAFRHRETGDIAFYVSHGYAYVHADTRGTGHSTFGDWRVLDQSEQDDVYDTIEWIADRPWSSGRIGMIGESYYAIPMWQAAAARPPHLTTIVVYDGAVDLYRDAIYHGGLLSVGFLNWWHTNTRALTLLDPVERLTTPAPANQAAFDFIGQALRHPSHDEFWRERSAADRLADIDIPVYSIANWNQAGLHLRGNLYGYEQVRGPRKLLINGGPVGDAHSSINIFNDQGFHEHLLDWFDHWLKQADTRILDEPAVRVSVRPDGSHRAAREWPLPGTTMRPLYLTSGPSGATSSLNDGRLTWDPPAADEDSTDYSYPADHWGGWPGLGNATAGPGRPPENLSNQTSWITEPLTEDLTVAGGLILELFASSDQVDTQFIVRVVDQPPATDAPEAARAPWAPVVSRGWLRAAHRGTDPARSTDQRPWHRHDQAEPLVPGQVTAFSIEILPTAWVFAKGHRIRVDIANADSPALDAPWNHHYGTRRGTDTYHHDRARPSRLLLPIPPADAWIGEPTPARPSGAPAAGLPGVLGARVEDR